MQMANDLARYAAMVADYLPLEDIESWAIQRDFTQEWTRVTFRLTNGRVKTYVVREEGSQDTPIGESFPSSPRE